MNKVASRPVRVVTCEAACSVRARAHGNRRASVNRFCSGRGNDTSEGVVGAFELAVTKHGAEIRHGNGRHDTYDGNDNNELDER